MVTFAWKCVLLAGRTSMRVKKKQRKGVGGGAEVSHSSPHSLWLHCTCFRRVWRGQRGRRESRGGRQREAEGGRHRHLGIYAEREGGKEALNGKVSVRRSLPVGAQCRVPRWSWICGKPATVESPNMSPRLLLCAVLAVYHGTQTCAGFNIDERFPVIKQGKTKGSFFGFSVALHQQTEGSRKYL